MKKTQNESLDLVLLIAIRVYLSKATEAGAQWKTTDER
jgi:hypothetical protein